MLDVRFHEKFQDALAVVISDQSVASLGILTNSDFHVHEDMAGRAWHSATPELDPSSPDYGLGLATDCWEDQTYMREDTFYIILKGLWFGSLYVYATDYRSHWQFRDGLYDLVPTWDDFENNNSGAGCACYGQTEAIDYGTCSPIRMLPSANEQRRRFAAFPADSFDYRMKKGEEWLANCTMPLVRV